MIKVDMEIYLGDDGSAFGEGNPWFIIRSKDGIELLIDTPNDPSRFKKAYEPEYIVITHLHGDHIGGLKRIVEYRSYLKKQPTTILCLNQLEKNLEVLLGYGGDGLVNRDKLLYKIVPLSFGEEYKIGDITLKLRPAIHTVPATGVIISEGNKRVLISGDHYYDPKYIRKLKKEGKINQEEFEMLNDWDFDLIFHDVGMAPYHTPPENLMLPEKIRKKILVYHTNEKFPGLEKANPKEAYKI